MSEDQSFVCKTCGQTHAGRPRDFAWKLPDDIWAIPEAERKERAKFTSDLAQLGERYFIRCVLPVPLSGMDDEFRFGLWVEVDWACFSRYLELHDVDGSGEPRYPGRLANVPPPYPDVREAPVFIQFGTSTQRPLVYFPEESEMPMAIEQRFGIDESRYHEILDGLPY